MSKHSIVTVVVGSLLLSLLPACDTGGGGPLITCATALVGSFEGPRQGPMVGSVQLEGPDFERGVFASVIAPEDVDRSFYGESTLEPDGTITGSGLLTVNGAIDLDDCSASGDWELGPDSGTWTLKPREHAF